MENREESSDMFNDVVMCDIIKGKIEDIDCLEIRAVAEREVKETFISAIRREYSFPENWKDICLHCKYHNY